MPENIEEDMIKQVLDAKCDNGGSCGCQKKKKKHY